MFSVNNLKHSYKGSQIIAFPDMQFEEGEEWLVLGPSGCGKTTLLHLMAGLLPIQQGEVVINQKALNQMNHRQRDRFRGQNIGIVFQQSHFVASLNLLDNVLLAQSLGHKIDKKKAISLLERLGLGERLKHLPHQLSVGEKQRASIARAVANSPKVILADEPTSALDDGNTESVIQLLRDCMLTDKATLIIVTHDTRLKGMVQNKVEL